MKKRPNSSSLSKKAVRKGARSVVVAPRASERKPRPDFPIVGIGTSAGGLDALERLFSSIPEDSGMAFVIVLHLDPTHECLMPELLGRVTRMKVAQAKDRTKVRPNCIYVIPPRRDVVIVGGSLRLREPTAPRGLRLPIDVFLRSLALDRAEWSVGVILSGMGTDGTVGVRAIKEQAGIVLVQDPASAKYDGMPRSVVDAGLADVVASLEELPARILACRERVPLALPMPGPEIQVRGPYKKIVDLLRLRTGHDISLYKQSSVLRRIERRMGIHQLTTLQAYVRHLEENTQELDILFKELLIGVTSFFRDPTAWDRLEKGALPGLLKARTTGRELRAWVPGCSTGEEAYSLGIALKETLARLDLEGRIVPQIFATDLDRDAIEKARQGLYPANIAADVSPERLEKYFTEEDRGYRIVKAIREMVIFAPQNLIMDPPFTRLDMITCRNLLIYLEPDLQKRLFPLFHYSMRPGGILFLGSAESVGGFGSLFALEDREARIFRRTDAFSRSDRVMFPPTLVPDEIPAPRLGGSIGPTTGIQALAEQAILQNWGPSAVLASERGDILYVNGRTGKYLEPASGKANWNLFAMAREWLRHELATAFQKSITRRRSVVVTGLQAKARRGSKLVDITIQPMQEPAGLRGTVLVVFESREAPLAARATDRGESAGLGGRGTRERARDLWRAQDALRKLRLEMQTSQEELRSANEELQSMNEELQSANEELTTSKEEMQSLNEELQTVNAELQAKVDELSRTSNDMKNLLDSTDIATVFLDGDLKVRRFTSRASAIINLIPGDLGRPLSDLSSLLLYPELCADAREVLRTLVYREKRVVATDDRLFVVRIMPYRTLENVIDGCVITFTDLTRHTRLGLYPKEDEDPRQRMEDLP